MIAKDKIHLPIEPMVKVVVDIERLIASFDCELHTDCYEELIRDGSKPENLWGANIYPGDGEIEFISMINIRPAQNNRSMEIQNPEIRKKIENIVKKIFLT